MSFDLVNTQMLAGLPARAHESSGAGVKKRTITFETEAADAAGDIKALCRVGAHEIPVKIEIINDAISGATDIDLGLYYDDQSAADADVLMDGTDISAGVAWASRTDGMSNVALEKRGVKSFAELVGDSIGSLKNDSYWLALTLNSEVAGAGSVVIHIETIDQQ